MEDDEIDQNRKKDILYLFKKGNPILADKNGHDYLSQSCPLFSVDNAPNQWFWSRSTVKISYNNTHMSNDHIENIIKYIVPFQYNATLVCDIDTSDAKTFTIITLGHLKIYKESQDKDTRTLIENHPYKNYYLFKLPPGKKLIFSAETDFNKLHIQTNEYDTDAQQEIKEIILFDVVDRSMLKLNSNQKFLYTDVELKKKELTSTFNFYTNTSAKFRRPHILPILPSYDEKRILYEVAEITKDKYVKYLDRIEKEDKLSFVDENLDDHIFVGFSVIGSSPYCTKFMEIAMTNLRRNISDYKFNDKDFVLNTLTMMINKLARINDNK